jgi:hypothetical protein
MPVDDKAPLNVPVVDVMPAVVILPLLAIVTASLPAELWSLSVFIIPVIL